MKKFIPVVLSVTMIVSLLAGCKDDGGTAKETPNSTETPQAVADNWNYQTSAIKSSDLLETGELQDRWLSIPDSRLVVNPFDFNKGDLPQSKISNDDDIPFNIGFLDPALKPGENGIRLDDASYILENPKDGGEAKLNIIFKSDFSNIDNWKTGKNFELKSVDNKLNMTVKKGATPPSQNTMLENAAEVDFSTDPLFQITVDKIYNPHPDPGKDIIARWALLINIHDVNGKTEKVRLQWDTDKTGKFTYDLNKIIKDAGLKGVEGKKKIDIIYYTMFPESESIVSEMLISSVGKDSSRAVSTEYSTTWAPDQLTFSAKYPGGLEVTGTDFFYDSKTVIRGIKAKGIPVIGGNIIGDKVVKNGEVIYITSDKGYAYAIAFSKAGKIAFYPNYQDLIINTNSSDTAKDDSKYWTFIPDELGENEELFVAVRVDMYKAGEDKVDSELKDIMSKNDFDAKRTERTKFWDDYFKKVPRPVNFSLSVQDAKDVSEDQMKRMYYKAWTLISASVLPENTEIGFNYKQVACGKPSMWGHGAEKSTYSASWESFIGMQFLSYVDPDSAWSAYKGLMSLVDDKGVLGGESLPSVKAQTAWVLYNNKKDKESLESIIPALERYLNWRMENPRWIFGDHDVAGDCDMDFIANLLVDMDYTVKIFEELGNKAKADEWKNKITEYYKNFQEWMIKGNNAYLIYNTITKNRSVGNVLWLSKGLNIPNITDEDFEIVFKRFKSSYKKDNVLGGFNTVKFDSMQYPIYAFINKGGDYLEIAQNLVEIAIRDVAQTNFLAEVYNPNGKVAKVEGVRPTLFGAGLMIDNLLIKNGFMYKDGNAKGINLFGKAGGVENLNIEGKVLNIKLDGEGNKLTLGGSYIGEEEKQIDLTVGQTEFLNK